MIPYVVFFNKYMFYEKFPSKYYYIFITVVTLCDIFIQDIKDVLPLMFLEK